MSFSKSHATFDQSQSQADNGDNGLGFEGVKSPGLAYMTGLQVDSLEQGTGSGT